MGVEDEKITTEVEIRKWMPVKYEALSCHRTQFEMDPETKLPKMSFTALPEPERVQLFGHERFVLARSAVALKGKEDDLFAGLRHG